jgi:hypothetical protein
VSRVRSWRHMQHRTGCMSVKHLRWAYVQLNRTGHYRVRRRLDGQTDDTFRVRDLNGETLWCSKTELSLIGQRDLLT